MFGEPQDPNDIPKGSIILQPHWQYGVKHSGVHQSQMCCNGLKKAVPQLHAVASTWSLCVKLHVQRLFLGICDNAGLTIYGRDATDAYVHSPASNDIYLQVDDTYAEWYNNKFKNKISKQMVSPVKHALLGQPQKQKDVDEKDQQHSYYRIRI